MSLALRVGKQGDFPSEEPRCSWQGIGCKQPALYLGGDGCLIGATHPWPSRARFGSFATASRRAKARSRAPIRKDSAVVCKDTGFERTLGGSFEPMRKTYFCIGAFCTLLACSTVTLPVDRAEAGLNQGQDASDTDGSETGPAPCRGGTVVCGNLGPVTWDTACTLHIPSGKLRLQNDGKMIDAAGLLVGTACLGGDALSIRNAQDTLYFCRGASSQVVDPELRSTLEGCRRQ
jgi:hypothetical protein